MSEIYREQPDIEEQSEEQELEVQRLEVEGLVEQIMEKHNERMKKLRENDYVEDSISLKERRECGPEIADLEKLFAFFYKKYSLKELNKLKAITNLTPKEAPNNASRESVKKYLIPIDIILKTLERETDIVSEEHIEKNKELKTRYKYISNTVGIINNNKVDHNR